MRLVYTSSMANKWEKKKKSEFEKGSLFRSISTPLFTVLGALVVSFIVMPAAFELTNPISPVMDIALTPAPSAAQATPAILTVQPQPPTGETTYLSILEPETAQVSIQSPVSQYPTLKSGDTDALVVEIQLRLMALCYIDGDEPTEYFGPATEAGIKLFQRAHYMTETGVADDLTLSLLFSDNATPYQLEFGNKGTDVIKLQNQLSDLGYYADKLNGYFGTATKRALVAFQTKNRLDQSGVADEDTLDVLYSSRARPKVDPTPTPTPKPTKTPKPIKTPQPTSAATQKPQNISTPKPPSGGGKIDLTPVGSDVEAFISMALAQEGKPYVYSAEGPDSYDCSGLVYYCLNRAGVRVGRMSARNFATASGWETITSSGSLQRGDLLFFTNSVGASSIGHTGIYLGNNKFIHASSSAGRVVISSWSKWCSDNFQWGKRVF